MKKKIIVIMIIVSIIIAGVCGYLIYYFFWPGNEFLLVETERRWHSELVEGNYTDGHLCFDFPMYSIDEKNQKIEDWGNTKKVNFKVVYGSGSFGGGLIDSGGASGLDYINELPFQTEENVKYANSYFSINISIKKDYRVFINEIEQIKPGERKIFSYDIIKKYTNQYLDEQDGTNNTTCLIRYTSNTTVKNYGFWKKYSIEFRDTIAIEEMMIENTIYPINTKRIVQ